MCCAHPVLSGPGRPPIWRAAAASASPQAGRILFLPLLVPFVLTPGRSWAQGGFQQISGKAFDAAIPRDFYLEGNAIPVEKRNAVLLKDPSGKRVLVALLDTSGYSSQVQEKYTGMLIGEAPVKVCGIDLGAGSYGFGLKRPARGTPEKPEFTVYDQGGRRLGGCEASQDRVLARPVPLQVLPETDEAVRIYLGRDFTQLILTKGLRR